MVLISMDLMSIMKGSGMLINEVGGAECILWMGLFMKENGSMTNAMGRDC